MYLSFLRYAGHPLKQVHPVHEARENPLYNFLYLSRPQSWNVAILLELTSFFPWFHWGLATSSGRIKVVTVHGETWHSNSLTHSCHTHTCSHTVICLSKRLSTWTAPANHKTIHINRRTNYYERILNESNMHQAFCGEAVNNATC